MAVPPTSQCSVQSALEMMTQCKINRLHKDINQNKENTISNHTHKMGTLIKVTVHHKTAKIMNRPQIIQKPQKQQAAQIRIAKMQSQKASPYSFIKGAHVKHMVSARSLPQKSESNNAFRFFVDKKGFSIIHGFVLVKLRFRSVNKRFVLYFLLVF